MDLFLAFTVDFSAGHSVHRGQPSRPHGHNWIVEATTTDPHDWALYDALVAVCLELKERPLEEMLAGGDPSAHGLGIWIMERLLLGHPKVIRIEVTESRGVKAIVTRELRGPTK